MEAKYDSFTQEVSKTLILIFCGAQVFQALAFIGLSIAAIFTGAGYWQIQMGFWGGLQGCIGAAVWAGVGSRPQNRRHPHGVVMLEIYAAFHLGYFLLSFFSANKDFLQAMSELNVITSESTNCSVASNISSSYQSLTASLIIDVYNIGVSMVAFILDQIIVALIIYRHGRPNFACDNRVGADCDANENEKAVYESNGSVSEKKADRVATVNSNSNSKSNSNSNADWKSNQSGGGEVDQVDELFRLFARTFFVPIFAIIVPFSLICASMDITALVLGSRVRLVPTVWNIVAGVFGGPALLQIRRNNKNWHIIAIVLFAVIIAADWGMIALGALAVENEWYSVYAIFESMAAYQCARSATSPYVAAFSQLFPSQLSDILWRLIVENFYILFNYYLGCLILLELILVVLVSYKDSSIFKPSLVL